jgi:NADH-quinone oxidoreductase subunit A
MNPYLPVLIVSVCGVALGLIMTGLSAFMGPKKPTKIKMQNFECGVSPVGERERMSVKFYLTAIIFILFDIETVFLYVWAKAFRHLGLFGLVEILVFMVILVAGYIYALRRGALEWD